MLARVTKMFLSLNVYRKKKHKSLTAKTFLDDMSGTYSVKRKKIINLMLKLTSHAS